MRTERKNLKRIKHQAFGGQHGISRHDSSIYSGRWSRSQLTLGEISGDVPWTGRCSIAGYQLFESLKRRKPTLGDPGTRGTEMLHPSLVLSVGWKRYAELSVSPWVTICPPPGWKYRIYPHHPKIDTMFSNTFMEPRTS